MNNNILKKTIMIKAININNLRNAEYLQFMKNVASLVEANNPTELNVSNQYDALVAKNAEIEALFKKELSNPITEELVALDERRDKCIMGLAAVIKGHTYNYKEDIKAAATALQNNLELYGANISRQNYQAETATLNSLIGDWLDKPALNEAVQTLNLLGWLQEMRAVNALFDEKYLKRTQDYGSASPENIKLKRDETNEVYYALRKFLEAYSVINSANPIFAKTTNELNALIDQYNTLLANRQANSNNSVTTPETPDASEEGVE